MECNNDINSMIDIAKVADLVSSFCSQVHQTRYEESMSYFCTQSDFVNFDVENINCL